MASLGLNELKKMGSLRHPQWYYLNKIKEPAHMVKTILEGIFLFQVIINHLNIAKDS